MATGLPLGRCTWAGKPAGEDAVAFGADWLSEGEFDGAAKRIDWDGDEEKWVVFSPPPPPPPPP